MTSKPGPQCFYIFFAASIYFISLQLHKPLMPENGPSLQMHCCQLALFLTATLAVSDKYSQCSNHPSPPPLKWGELQFSVTAQGLTKLFSFLVEGRSTMISHQSPVTTSICCFPGLAMRPFNSMTIPCKRDSTLASYLCSDSKTSLANSRLRSYNLVPSAIVRIKGL